TRARSTTFADRPVERRLGGEITTRKSHSQVPPWPPGTKRLFSFQRRVIGRQQKNGFYFFNQLAVFFGLRLDGFPLGVSHERFPALCRRSLTGKSQQAEQLVLGLAGIRRAPEADERHAVFLEQPPGMVPKPGVQGLHFSGCGMVGSQLENPWFHNWLPRDDITW